MRDHDPDRDHYDAAGLAFLLMVLCAAIAVAMIVGLVAAGAVLFNWITGG